MHICTISPIETVIKSSCLCFQYALERGRDLALPPTQPATTYLELCYLPAQRGLGGVQLGLQGPELLREGGDGPLLLLDPTLQLCCLYRANRWNRPLYVHAYTYVTSCFC